MATSSVRKQTIQFTGDVVLDDERVTVVNTLSPATIQQVNLANGNNTIAVPIGGLVQGSALTIIPPAGNVNTMTLKGVAGDVGVAIHPSNLTTIALSSAFAALVITTGGAINGVILIWS